MRLLFSLYLPQHGATAPPKALTMELDRNELVSALALNRIFGFEPKISHTLIDNLGSAAAVFRLSRDELEGIFGPYSRHAHLINESELEKSARELDRLESMGIGFLHIKQEGYPELLRECDDAPTVLYVRSDTPADQIFNRRPHVAAVGTRDISPYGKYWCETIISGLSKAPIKPLIVSGMAIGIDITAHMAAIASGLPTVGVLPTGIDEVYPRRHRIAAEKICATPGCALITDYPPGTTPVAVTFLRRNRIIAGICGSTLLLESRVKGGGMMTAYLASGYGRDVYCLPGRIDDPGSSGCNLLIQQKTAEAIASVETLAESLGLGRYKRRRSVDLMAEVREQYAEILDAQELKEISAIADAIRQERGITIDELSRKGIVDYSGAARWAGMLESDGFICMDVLQRCSIKAKK